MTDVSIGSDEQLRLAALKRYLVLDTAAEQSFDRLTAFAAHTFGMPLAFVSLIDNDRQWFKSCFGIDVQQTGRDVAFCNHTILSSEVMVVADARQDARFAHNPLVTGEPHIRFYAGAPLRTKDGYNLGSLCVADMQPHHSFTLEQRNQLTELAYFVMELLESRLVTQVLKNELVVQGKDITDKLTDSEKRFHLLAQHSKDIIVVSSPDGTLLYVSPASQNVLNYAPEELVGQSVYKFVHEDDLGAFQKAYRLALRNSKLKVSSFRFRAQNGEYLWLELATHTIFDPRSGNVVEIQTACRNISRRKAAEAALKESEAELLVSEANYRALYISATTQAQELSLLHKVRNTLSQTLALPDLIEKIVEAIVQEFGYSHVAIFLLQGDTLVLQHQIGHSYDLTTLSLNQGVNGRVALTGESAFIPDVASDPDFIRAGSGIVSEICVPLFDNQKVVGTLNIESTVSRELTPNDQRVLEALGEYISLAINRSRLFREVSETAERLQTVVNNAPLILYTLDQEGKFTFSTGKSLATLGIQPNHAVGRSIFEVYGHNPHMVRDARRVLAGESFNSFVEFGGRVFDSFYTAIKDEKGKVTSVIGVSTDVTERRQAEIALQREQEFALQVMENLGQGLVVLDPAFTITYVNPAMAEMLGYSIEELTGKTPFDIVPLYYHARLKDELSQRLTGQDNTYEIEMVGKNGQLLYMYISSKGIFQEGKLARVIAVCTDLTERKQVEQSLRRSLEKEKELGELKDRLITTASHEFRTPLSAIISSTELLQFYSHRWNEEKKIEILNRISQSANKITGLIDDILTYNRSENGKLECNRAKTDLSGMCQDFINNFKAIADDNKSISFVEIEKSPKSQAYLDQKLLGYILNNLLSNALKYSKPGGMVELELEWQPDRVLFKIKDQGIGIPAKDQSTLFDPFQRASNVGNINGTGFGLAIVKQSVKAHGGQISFESVEDQGTIFTVSIPLEDTASENNSNLLPAYQDPEKTFAHESDHGMPTPGNYENSWLLEQAIEASSNGVLITDATKINNPIIYASKGFEKLTGFSREEVLGRNCRFMQGDDLNQDGLVELRKAIKEERECLVQLRNYRKDGSLFWNELLLSPIRNQVGRVIYFVGIQNDVSDRIRAEAALNQSERKFKALVENSPDLIARFDRNRRFLYVNPTLEIISKGRISVEKATGKTLSELDLSSNWMGDFETCLKKVVETAEPTSFEIIDGLPPEGTRCFLALFVPELSSDGDEKEVQSVLTIGRDITELKRTNEALQVSKNLLNDILESITDAFFTLDLDWNFIYLNPQAGKLLKRPREELIGKNVWQEFPQAEDSNFGKMYQLARKEMIAVSFEEYYAPLETWFDVRAFPSVTGLSIYFHDINQLKRVEEALSRSEVHFRSLIEYGSDVITLLDADNRIKYVSPSVERMMGYKADVLTGLKWLESLLPEETGTARKIWQELMENPGLTITAQLQYLHNDGTWRYSETTFQNLLDLWGVEAVVLHSRDIHEHKLAEEALQKSEQEYRMLMEQAPDAIYICDEKEKILVVNEACCTLTGYTREEILQKSIFDLAPRDLKENSHPQGRVLAKNEIITGIRKLRRKDGSWITIETNFRLLEDNRIVGVVRNSAERSSPLK